MNGVVYYVATPPHALRCEGLPSYQHATALIADLTAQYPFIVLPDSPSVAVSRDLAGQFKFQPCELATGSTE